MENSHIAFGIVLALVGAGRLIELRKSKQHLLKAEKSQESIEYHYVLMVAIHTLLFLLPPLEVLFFAREFQSLLGLNACFLVLLSTFLRLWVIRSLGRSWNTRGLVGKDLQVVTDGPYRWLRHPNYLAVIIEIAALPLIHSAYGSAIILTVANGVILAIRIPWEEKQLFAVPGYLEAFGKKPRLLPFPVGDKYQLKKDDSRL